ncbi:hypothetical protein BDQ17DRAFT_1368154 [Cyathus striatus]|nr:hypothetical protein BDQ17DRAFT_1376341 [Cyathus striatus]KAF8993555.1 hypothetical protein BDQ17DRAFT_1368154 [Cyathus striatus]
MDSKSNQQFEHPVPFYDLVVGICANIQRARNNLPPLEVMPAPSSASLGKRSRSYKSTANVESDSEVEVVTAKAPSLGTVASAAETSVEGNTEMQIDDTNDSLPIPIKPRVEPRAETMYARKKARIDLTFPRFPDVRKWVTHVLSTVEGRHGPVQAFGYRDAILVHRSASLLEAITRLEQDITAAKATFNELDRMSASPS